MKVKELIDILSTVNPESEVYLATQPFNPTQHDCIGALGKGKKAWVVAGEEDKTLPKHLCERLGWHYNGVVY